MAELHSIHSDIIERCRQNDRSAQMQLYNLYYKAMYNTSLRIVHDSAEAEDIMQESFLTAFQKLNELNDDSLFAAWMKKIVVRKSLNAYKSRQRFDFDSEPEVVSTNGHEPKEDNVSVEAVKACLDMLPDGYKVVLNLYLLEGFDHEEIADILGITSSTSRSQYNRGKQKLKQLLTEERWKTN